MYICIYVYMAVDQTLVLSRGPPALRYKPLSRPAVSNPLSRISRGYDSTYYLRVGPCFWGVCRGGVCRRTPPSVTKLCREMAANASCKANVFGSLPYQKQGNWRITLFDWDQGSLQGSSPTSVASRRLR